ncbi:hypothetical protein [Clostridium omnivorum]|uniref:Uncharacterized protein n=1 Tax=Clostridium omnivorum TaxID=1604902 RepID=A0ABQ5N578_9CLOT|nr:hypothetical protein [Clostridium sp. E14]GLC30383.1 hypothetical protein bsdE14_17930 [Clostridium sp. E14]
MKIYIKQSNGRTFHIPVPLSIAGFGCNLADFIIRVSKKYMSEQEQEYMDCIDFKKLSLSLKELKGYHGLKLVDVKTLNGEEVVITL